MTIIRGPTMKGKSLQIARAGIILNTENFDACVSFYKQVLGLKLLFEEQSEGFRLACLDCLGTYLMIETGGVSVPSGKTVSQNSTKFRFNVKSIENTLNHLKSKNIDAQITNNSWGQCINIFDPDGNRVAFRDESTFVSQIQN